MTRLIDYNNKTVASTPTPVTSNTNPEAAMRVLLNMALILYSAFVAFQAWAWFVVPLGASRISYIHAVGLVMFVQLLTSKRANIAVVLADDEKTRTTMGMILSVAFFHAVMFLASFGV